MNNQNSKINGFFIIVFSIFFSFGIGSITNAGIGAITFSLVMLLVGAITKADKIDWSWIDYKS